MDDEATIYSRVPWGVPALVGAGALGLSVGRFSTNANFLLVLLGVAGLVAAIRLARRNGGTAGSTVEVGAVAVVVVFSISAIPSLSSAYTGSWSGWVRLFVALVVLIGVILPPLRTARLQVAVGIVLIGLVTFLLVTAISANPDSRIDVQYAHTEAASLLFEGRNPYRDMVVEDTSPPEANQGVIVGYSYPPVTLLTYSLAAAVGDARLAGVVAVVALLATVLVVAVRSFPGGSVFPGVLATVPFLAGIVIGGWTEPLQAALLVASTAIYRRWVLSSIVLGLAVASKQYMVLALVPILVSADGHRYRRVVVAVGVAAATYIPFLVWDPGAMWYSLVGYQLQRLPRVDAASLWSIGLKLPAIVALLLAVGICLVAWRQLGTPATILLGQAGIFGVYFLLAPNSFGNFWFLVTVIAVAAVAFIKAVPHTAGDGTLPTVTSPETVNDG